MRLLVMASLLTACGPDVATLAFATPPPTQITTAHPVRLPPLIGRSAKGAPLDSLPKIEWSVSPPGLVELGVEDDAAVLTPRQNGDVVVTAKVRGEKIEATANVGVRVVNRVSTRCTRTCRLQPGESTDVDVIAYAGDKVVDAPVSDWKSSDPSIAEVTEGRVAARQPGRVKITAVAAEQPASIDIEVEAIPDRVVMKCPTFLVESTNAGESIQICPLVRGQSTQIRASAYAGDKPRRDVPLSFAVLNDKVLEVSPSGAAIAKSEGTTVVKAGRDEALFGQLVVEVQIPQAATMRKMRCGAKPYPYKVRLPIGDDAEAIGTCTILDAPRCILRAMQSTRSRWERKLDAVTTAKQCCCDVE